MPNAVIASDQLRAEISPRGAELQRLTTADGLELLWDGDPAVWSGRAPLLFPIVGALAEGHFRYGGRNYPMARHGFARVSTFALVDTRADLATFRLVDTPDTREDYPFEFVLDVTHSVEGATLTCKAVVTNTGEKTMPLSFGFHPALRWPLPFGAPRGDHCLTFAEDEPAPIRRLDEDGLLRAERLPSPVERGTLRLDDGLFDDDALVFDAPVSRSVTYGAPGKPGLRVDFEGMPYLVVWTKPGADYVCIEPWQGQPDPAGFTGDIRDKPGVVLVQPGDEARFALNLTLER
ncbi:galactose mutarotase-like enzyme [Novosphingobium kunmingense]|uniref:Galactose mutarotase-like enzyme n=1 Tax=Novosphingobium kunmingense TaxID=1211806 RepID=A0A2N0HKS5_9SPHN|nr:aldose 1-epimerase family protein [Novosphingobium kunmingense]PKB19465.1 galactose mutarotase-like enzyme [Novosphingobium kunmingense]